MGEGYERAKARERDQFKTYCKAPKRRVEEEDLFTRSMKRCYEQEFMVKAYHQDLCPAVSTEVVLQRKGEGVEVVDGTTPVGLVVDEGCKNLASLIAHKGGLLYACVSRRCSVERDVFFITVQNPTAGVNSDVAATSPRRTSENR